MLINIQVSTSPYFQFVRRIGLSAKVSGPRTTIHGFEWFVGGRQRKRLYRILAVPIFFYILFTFKSV